MKRLVTDQPVRAALYARVSSDQQQSHGTIASQVAALHQALQEDGHHAASELCFVDDGYSGSHLIRPALERLRDAAALGTFDRLYVLAPDRLARHLAHQALLLEELQRAGVTLHFVNRPLGDTPEDQLLLQVQGVVAEYERAKILERSRRGKLHAAKSGALSVLGGAPYGYRYVSKHDGSGQARYEVVREQEQVVRQLFAWVGLERLSLNEVRRRLAAQGVPSPRGRPSWNADTIRLVLLNRAYAGTAEYGKTRVGPARSRLRPYRGQGPVPRRQGSIYETSAAERIGLAVPALVSAELFAQVAEQLAENRQRHRRPSQGPRHLLQGLVVCPRCGYACSARVSRRQTAAGEPVVRVYYRCNGTDRQRFAGQQLCANRPVRAEAVEAAVWQDVCALLRHPEKIEQEYQRRQEDPAAADAAQAAALGKQVQQVQQAIGRLIDAYAEGYLDKSEFEPRLQKAKAKLGRLQEELAVQQEQQAQWEELRLVIGCVRDFGERVGEGLATADWSCRREIIRTLVKCVEVDLQQIRIVYRISPVTVEEGPNGGCSQHCRGRVASQR